LGGLVQSNDLSVGNVVSGGAGLNRGSVAKVAALQHKLNLVDASVKGGRATSEVVLVSSGRDRHLEVDGISVGQRNALDCTGTSDAGKALGGLAGDLAHQLTREVGSTGKGVGAVLVRSITIGGVGLVDSVERSVNGSLGNGTLASKVRQKSVFIAKQINTVRSVEELIGKVADEVVLDEVSVGDDIAGGSQDGVGEHTSVDGVQRTIGGPVVHVDVILDIRSIKIIDIYRVRLKLEDGLHIASPDIVDSDGADIKSGRGFSGEFTRDTESKSLVKTSKGKVHHNNCLL